MKHPKIILTQVSAGYVLTTILGNPVGQRLLTGRPEDGKDYPVVPTGPIASRSQAEKLRLDWNVYLRHAWKTRSKTKERSAD